MLPFRYEISILSLNPPSSHLSSFLYKPANPLFLALGMVWKPRGIWNAVQLRSWSQRHPHQPSQFQDTQRLILLTRIFTNPAHKSLPGSVRKSRAGMAFCFIAWQMYPSLLLATQARCHQGKRGGAKKKCRRKAGELWVFLQRKRATKWEHRGFKQPLLLPQLSNAIWTLDTPSTRFRSPGTQTHSGYTSRCTPCPFWIQLRIKQYHPCQHLRAFGCTRGCKLEKPREKKWGESWRTPLSCQRCNLLQL